MNKFDTPQARWQAVLEKEQTAVGHFFYAVTTTGIYCLPTCTSRRPKQAHVRFFTNIDQAKAEGFRPCKRCQPDNWQHPTQTEQAIKQACDLLMQAETPLSLEELATAVHLSPSHLHRQFKKQVGVTPKQYAMAVQEQRLRQTLPQSRTITQAIYHAGFESSSRAYERATAVLGMTPTQYQTGATNMTIQYAIVETYLGYLLVAATHKGICQLELGSDPNQLQQQLIQQFPKAQLQTEDATFAQTVAEVVTFIQAPTTPSTLPLDIQGTAFQKQVWAELQNLLPGTTITYSELAHKLGKPKAARAVANACASNKIAVLIPCHRVVRADGALGGYRWGITRKQTLLTREQEHNQT